LQPIGLDAIRITSLGKDGYPTALLHSLRYDSDGKWYLEWSERKTDDEPWVHHFELLSNSQPSWGYASLLRMEPNDDVRLNWDLLAEAFKITLAEAIEQSTMRMPGLGIADRNADLNMLREACRAAD
jgi:hypothetical protein